MAEKTKPKNDTPDPERDDPVKIDLDPEVALKALLKVEPRPVEKDEEPPRGDPLRG
jgi:hypothetical protein